MNTIGERGLLKAELRRLIGDELPGAFVGGAPKALRSDVVDELVARYPDVSETALRLWMTRWLNSRPYLMKLGHARHYHDLDGRQVAPVSEDDRRWAYDTVAYRGRELRRQRNRQRRAA